MMRNMVLIALVAALALASSAEARGLKQEQEHTYPYKFVAMLSGSNGVPPIESMAHGKSHLVIESAEFARVWFQIRDIKVIPEN
jgi:hypothetical protein